MNKVKYPRTMHLPWSESVHSDDRCIKNIDAFVGREVWVTEKMDGENSTVYQKYYHAQSLETESHPSRDQLKAFIATWQQGLRDNERVCGENIYAQHSIIYDSTNPLPHFFLGFSMWQNDICLSVDETLENFAILGITPVKTLYQGIWDEEVIRSLYLDEFRHKTEGYVVRVADSFRYGEFAHSVAKFVRHGHVQTNKHWKTQPVIPNVVDKSL